MENNIKNGISSTHSTLSRNEKALVKRNVQRSMLSNHVSSDQGNTLNKKLRRPKGYLFWAIVFAISIIAIANLFLTITIFSVLRLTKTMEHIEVLPPINGIKFFGETNFNSIVKADGQISGFSDSPIEILGLGSALNLKVKSEQDTEGSPMMNIDLDSVELMNINRFDILEPKKWVKSSAFSTMFPNFGLPKGVQTLHINKASASRIVSNLEGSLALQTDSLMRIRGNEGVVLQGRELILSADQDLSLRSINGSVTFDAAENVMIDIDNLVINHSNKKDNDQVKPVVQYKLCICMPQATLFRIPVLEGTNTIHCNSIDFTDDNNPCLV